MSAGWGSSSALPSALVLGSPGRPAPSGPLLQGRQQNSILCNKTIVFSVPNSSAAVTYRELKHLPSERVFTVWGSLADFIIAVKVIISVRSRRLQPVHSPFISKMRCFYKEKDIKHNLNSLDTKYPLISFILGSCIKSTATSASKGTATSRIHSDLTPKIVTAY